MKNWTTTHYKPHARRETIIDVYRSRFNIHKIPNGKQYWSLCSDCTNDGEPHKDTEIGQMIHHDIISEQDFVGVDIDSNTISRNTIAYPHATWICNDFFAAMCEVDTFEPAIVNFDTISTPKYAIPVLGDIINIVLPNTMIVCNMILKCRNQIILPISEISQQIQIHLSGVDVDFHPDIMTYLNGTTEMATIVCYT